MKTAYLKKRKASLAVLVILAAVFVLNFIIIPLIGKFGDLNSKIGLNEARFRKALSLIAEQEKINSIYSSFANVADISEAVTADEEKARISVYKYIDNLAAASKVKLKSVRPIVVYDSKGKDLYFEVRAEASISGLITFLYNIENRYGLISIEKIQISPYGSGKFAFDMQIKRILM